MPWTTAATAPTQLIAEMWQGLLNGADIPTRVVPANMAMFAGVMSLPCQLMVPDDLLGEAKVLLGGVLGDDADRD